MLIDTDTLDLEPIERFMLYDWRRIVAIDLETGATLRIGAGRRKAGRAQHYFIYAPIMLLPAGHYEQTQIATLTASTDTVAFVQANRRLDKLLARHRREVFPEQYVGGNDHGKT